MLAEYPSRSHWWLYILLYILLIVLTPKTGHPSDVSCWVAWATYMGAHGLTSGYELDSNNYNPLYQYVLFAYGKVAQGAGPIYHYRHLLKTVTLLFDFWGAIWAVRQFGWGDGNQRFILSLLFLLNVGYLYNTVVWEQVDAILGTLVFAAVVQALRQRTVSSMVFFLLAINMKTQGVIFLPPLLLLWVPQWWQAPRRLAIGILLMVAAELVVLAPYIIAGNVMRIFYLVHDAVGYFPVTSMNCYNIWMWLVNPYDLPDFNTYLGYTYKQWGLVSFCVASAAVLLPLGLATLNKLRQRAVFESNDYEMVLLSLGLIPVVFCFFNTQMHERYWHPALLLLGSHAILTRRYFLFALFSLAYFLNLEGAFRFQSPTNEMHTMVLFRPKVVAIMFAVVMAEGVRQLYWQAGLLGIWQALRQRQ